MKGMKLKCAWLLAALLFAVASPSGSTTNDIDRDMAEAIFRYQFEHNGSGQQTNAGAYFIALGGKDPDDAFVKRFEGHCPPVKKWSQCSTENMCVTDKETLKQGVVFSIEEIVATGTDSAEANGGYYENGMSASGNTYYLKRKKGIWVVEKNKTHWISRRTPANGVDRYVSYRAASA